MINWQLCQSLVVSVYLPTLKDLAEGGTFLLAAMVLLNLLEVQPRTTHLPLIVVASKSWLAAFPDDRAFWIDQGVGRYLCALIDAVLALDPRLFASDQASRGDIDRLLESLVRQGIAEAYQFEDKRGRFSERELRRSTMILTYELSA